MAEKSNYQSIADNLVSAIRSGRYRAGERLPSSNELAREFGVSRNTTVRALQEVIRAGLAHAVRGAGTSVNALPRPAGTPSGNSRQLNIGILLSNLDDVNHPYCRKHLSNIGARAAEAGYGVRIFAVAPEKMHEFLEERPFDGLLVLGEFPREVIQLMLDHAIPAVLLGNDWPGVPVSAVMPELAPAIAQAFVKLFRRGRRRFLVVPGPAGNPVVNAFYLIYRQETAHLELAENECRFIACDWGESAGYELGKKLFATGYRPDALIAGEDYLACGIIRAAEERGICFPQDFSVIGGGNYPDLPGGRKLSSLNGLPQAADTEALHLLCREIRGEIAPGTKRYLKVELLQRKESL